MNHQQIHVAQRNVLFCTHPHTPGKIIRCFRAGVSVAFLTIFHLTHKEFTHCQGFNKLQRYVWDRQKKITTRGGQAPLTGTFENDPHTHTHTLADLTAFLQTPKANPSFLISSSGTSVGSLAKSAFRLKMLTAQISSSLWSEGPITVTRTWRSELPTWTSVSAESLLRWLSIVFPDCVFTAAAVVDLQSLNLCLTTGKRTSSSSQPGGLMTSFCRMTWNEKKHSLSDKNFWWRKQHTLHSCQFYKKTWK